MIDYDEGGVTTRVYGGVLNLDMNFNLMFRPCFNRPVLMNSNGKKSKYIHQLYDEKVCVEQVRSTAAFVNKHYKYYTGMSLIANTGHDEPSCLGVLVSVVCQHSEWCEGLGDIGRRHHLRPDAGGLRWDG